MRAILAKDLAVELRARQLLPVMIMLGVLIAWVFRIAIEAAPVDRLVVAGAVLLIAVLFCAILASEKSFSVEQQDDCISGILLAPVDAGDIYLSKLLVSIFMLCIFEVVMVPVLLVFYQLDVAGRWPELIAVLLLIDIGVSSVGTLLGCLVQGAKAQGALLSVLVMAVLCPLMMPAVFALLVLFGAADGQMGGGGVLGMVGSFRAAVGYMAAFDAIFVTVCWLLFGFVAGE